MESYVVEKFEAPLKRMITSTPNPQGSGVVMRISACGVCHSDIHIQDGYFSLGKGRRLELAKGVSLPRTPGHEIAGVVAAVGPDVKNVKVGDRRVVFPWIGCGACSLCEAGDEHLCNRSKTLGINCDGGFSDHVLVPDERYLLSFDGLKDEQACTLACSGLTAYSALKKAMPFRAEDSIVVIGAGGVGLSGIRLAKQVWNIAPIVVEIDRRKWALAEAAGAGQIIDPTEEGALSQLVRSTRGGVSAAIDFVGAGETLEFAVGSVRKAGKVISVGMLGGSAAVPPALLSMKAISIVGSCVGSLSEMKELLDIARRGVLPDLPIETAPLQEANAVIERLRSGQIMGRAILLP